MPLVVSDTSPIRALDHLKTLELLGNLFPRVLIPPAVAAELDKPRDGITAMRLSTYSFIEIRSPTDQRCVEELLQILDPGESEALALALEVKADAVLMDEAAGRAKAKELGLHPLGVLGILVRFKQRSLVTDIAPLLDRLQSDVGFFISCALRDEILKLAGEQ